MYVRSTPNSSWITWPVAPMDWNWKPIASRARLSRMSARQRRGMPAQPVARRAAAPPGMDDDVAGSFGGPGSGIRGLLPGWGDADDHTMAGSPAIHGWRKGVGVEPTRD